MRRGRSSECVGQYDLGRTFDGAEDNADAHLKRQVMGREVVAAVTEGRLDFGPWEQIFYGEFDGMRMLITDLENLLGKPVPAAAVIPEKPTDKGQPYDPADLAGGGTTTSWWRRYRLPVMATAGTLLVAGEAQR